MSTLASVYGGNLGDALWLTPLARYEPDLTVWMRGDDAKAKAVAPILDGVCKVKLEPNPPETKKAPIRAHVTQQILAAYGHQGKPSIPHVLLRTDEVLWAVEFLREKGYTSNSIAFVNQNSANGDLTNRRAQYVRPPSDTIKRLASFWARGGREKIFQFGPDPSYYTIDPFEPIPGAVQIRGLSVRQLAACYHVIGKLVSGDTGDKHLMLAVGGKVACLVPEDSEGYGYRHYDLLYDSVCWGSECPRVIYALHDQWTSFLRTNLFD